MHRSRLLFLPAWVLALVVLPLSACDDESDPGPINQGLQTADSGAASTEREDERVADAGPIADPDKDPSVPDEYPEPPPTPDPIVPPGLTWYTTCGDPVCGIGHRPSGLPECSKDESDGNACDQAGAQCDLVSDCNVHLVCAAQDPKMGPGGCPISRRRYKKDIRYLDREDISRAHQELLALRLATYRYRKGDGQTQLGFIMEDVEPSLAVDSDRGIVNLYGYASLAVAALQSQDDRIQALEAEITQLRAALMQQK